MHVRDLNPRKKVHKSPKGTAVHLAGGCQALEGKRSRRVEVGKLYGDTPVCKHCLKDLGTGEKGGRGPSAARALERTDPDDFPGLPGGAR